MNPDSRGTLSAPRTVTDGAERAIGFEELGQLVENGAVTTVLLAVPDMQGRLKGKRYDAHGFLRHVATDAAEMCAYILATDVGMCPLDGYELASFDTGYGDFSLRPDATAVHQLAWMRRTVLVFTDALGHDGRPVDVAPRYILQRQLDHLAAGGITAQVGLECEVVLYQGYYTDAERTGYRRLRPLSTSNLDYALDHPPLMARYFQELEEALAGTDLPVEAIKSEGAPGQAEVTFRHGDPLRAADGHLLFKHAARNVGQQVGVAPTFMAAPATGIGSGLHIHLSLHRDGQPLFSPASGEVPETARSVVAGLLEALPHLAPLYAPTVNSYKRFTPGTFAPLNFSWGHDNRTCAIRVVGTGDDLHLEVRLPGADANPYLALAAVLAAAGHGLDRKLDPPCPIISNAFEASNAPLLPNTLEEAHASLCDGPLADELLTPKVAEHYALAARHEIDVNRTAVTGEELRRGFATA
ncbi:glutamine synthetase family protein [Streptomyces xiangluensis]|uniref:Glutamine synthetase family protein n=1 Tax=Streptomyces xiangluensis TaxID=2665720 RepID=A0ABV8YI12_9ACTN